MSTTIDDIAKACGLSRATVSRVLRNSPRVSDKSRQLVKKVIKETGYQPNQMAQSLAQGYSNTVALIVGNISSVAQIEIAKSIQKSLYAHNIMVWLCNSDYDPSLCDAYLDAALASKLAGAFLVTINATQQKLHQATERGMPIVLVNRQEMFESCDSILSNDQKAAHQAVRHLVSLGHKNIALLSSSHSQITSYNAFWGYRAALKESNIAFREDLVYEFDVKTYSDTLHPRSTFDAEFLFQRTPDATAVICSNNETAVEFYVQCRKLGKEIPRDISLVCLDPVQSNVFPELSFCTFGAKQQLLGETAVKQMLSRIQARKEYLRGTPLPPCSSIILEPTYLPGNSVKKIQG